MLNSQGKLFVISGPSGSGKTTLAKRVVDDYGKALGLEKSISFCTRRPRAGEIDEKDYFFVTKEDFLRLKTQRALVEWTKYLNSFYGTSKKYLDDQLKKNKNILLCLDFKGAEALKKLYPKNTVTIFILPPSPQELEKRVRQRGNIDDAEFISRMKLAKEEKQYAKAYDYTIINDNLDLTLNELVKIIKINITLGAN